MPAHKQNRCALVSAFLAAADALAGGTAWPTSTDVTEAAGITFKHGLGDFEWSNIVEATGPGGLFFDYDNAGYVDLFIANGDPHHLCVEELVLACWDDRSRFIDVARQSGDFFLRTNESANQILKVEPEVAK
jgi:hypothetical protein